MKKPSGFWQDSLHSMHPSMRIRYIPYFAMAETMDKSFDGVLSLWRDANGAVLHAWRSMLK